MQEVRLAVQRALDKLINRFGKESDVIGELRAALAALDKQGVEATVASPAVSEVPTPVTSEEAEPPPKTPKRAYGGRKK